MKVGIVLGGGLAKGAYQFGFLKSLLNYIPYEDIKIVSSASIGLFNAYGLCAKKMDEVEQIWASADFTLSEVLKECWFKGYIKKRLKEVVKEDDKLYIPFYTTINYLPFIGRYYLLKGDYSKKWVKFFNSAIGFPIVTGPPRFYKGWITIDGGAFDNIPIYPLMEKHDLDLIICVHFDSQYVLKSKWRNSKTIVIDLDASLNNDLRKHSFNFTHEVLDRMLKAGYEYGENLFKFLFKDGYDNIEGIRKNAEEVHNNEFEARMKDGTIDRLVTILNGLSQVFRSKKCIKNLVKDKKNE